MTPRRTAPFPTPSPSPRSSVDAHSHPQIDAVLKQLKSSSRRLHAIFASHRNELQILERLYYKGKNQHRTALFWRRVAEMRRFSDRLDAMNMHVLVENMRLSFWGDPATRSSKTLKGPWTHIPDTKSLLFVLRRCSDGRALVDQTLERLQQAYHSFMLMMQTAAFLQLILTLAAIASRLRMLLLEMLPTLNLCSKTCYQVLQILDPSQAIHAQYFLPPDFRSSPTVTPTMASIPPAATQHHYGLDEDMGSTIERLPASSAQEVSLARKITEATTTAKGEMADVESSTRTPSDIAMTCIVTSMRAAGNSTNITAATSKPASLAAGSDRTRAMLPPQAKRKKKRDEIDDIFGF